MFHWRHGFAYICVVLSALILIACGSDDDDDDGPSLDTRLRTEIDVQGLNNQGQTRMALS